MLLQTPTFNSFTCTHWENQSSQFLLQLIEFILVIPQLSIRLVKNQACSKDYSPFWHAFHSDRFSAKHDRANSSAGSVRGPGTERKQRDGCTSQTLGCTRHTPCRWLKTSHVLYFSLFLVSLIFQIFIVLFPQLDFSLQLYEIHFTDYKIYPFNLYNSVGFDMLSVVESSPLSNFRTSLSPPNKPCAYWQSFPILQHP